MGCLPLVLALFFSSQEAAGAGRPSATSSATSLLRRPRGQEQEPHNGRARGSLPGIFVVGAVLMVALSLVGCCRDPAPQLNWQPDTSEFNRLAERVSEHGLWRGSGFNKGPPGYITGVQGMCTSNRGSKYITGGPGYITGNCESWKYHGSNCYEKTFGMCNCRKMSLNGKFCTKWTCSDLEADQFVCQYVRRCKDTSSRRRGRRLDGDQADEEEEEETHEEALDMTKDVISGNWSAPPLRRLDASFHDRFEGPAPDRKLSEECHVQKECFDSEMEMTEPIYRMFKDQHMKYEQIGGTDRMFAFIARGSHFGWFQTQFLCIVPGDFEGTIEDQMASQRHYCHDQVFFREIEEQLQQCECPEGSFDQTHCASWSCTKNKGGLFGVLFERPPPNFRDLVDGLLEEDFECDIAGGGELGGCRRWSGKHRSWKEADMSRCECKDEKCLVWDCDEYKVLVTHPWYWYGAWGMGQSFTLACCCFLGGFMIAGPSSARPAGGCCLALGVLLAGSVFWSLGVWGFFFLVLPPTLVCGGAGGMFGAGSHKVGGHSDTFGSLGDGGQSDSSASSASSAAGQNWLSASSAAGQNWL